jgi:tetratricopeptide (TPR) repeat protein
VIAFNHGDWPGAKSAVEAAQKIKPEEPRAKLLLGRIALEQGDFATAEKEIKAVTVSEHPPELAYEFLGDVYFRKKDYLQSRDAYATFLGQKPKNEDGVLKLIYSELGAGNVMTASEELLKLDPYNDVHPGYYFAKAAIAQASGKAAQAEKHLQMARTMYGNKTFADYMKTYLELFPPQEAKPENSQ